MTNLFEEQEFEEVTDSTMAPANGSDGATGPITKTLFGRKPKKVKAFALDFNIDAPVDVDVEPGKKRSVGRRALRAFGGVGLVFLLLIGGITGWGYLKFRAIPKIDVQADDFGRIGPEDFSTIPYDELFTESTQESSEPIVMTNTVPLTAPTVPTSAPLTTRPKPKVVTNAVSETTEVASGTLVPEGAELLPVDTTPVTIDQVTAEALAEADAQDAAEVKDPKVAKDPKKPKVTTVPKEPVVFEKVGPGPIVKVDGVEPFGGPGTKNYLMIGVDDRKSVDDSQKDGFGKGQVGGSRTDTILILRIDATNHKAWILSIPRDLWVPLATSGRPSRINAAYTKGATELMNTIQQRLSIPIDHIVQVDFAGFQKVVSTVGGVEVCFDKPTRDLVSSLARREPGCQMLDGNGATAYVRSRHYQQFVDGQWREDPRSDLGRIIRQQKFIRSVMKRALDQASNPLAMNAMLDNLKTAVAIDTSFTFPETAAMANDLRSFDPNSLEAFTLPTSGARVNGAAVLKLNTKTAAALIGKFKSK
jgi:LCP family protein required for cell wall assembly